MTELGFSHSLRTAGSALVAVLRCVRSESGARFEWLDAAGTLLLAAHVGGPGATRILDAAGREIAHAGAPQAGSPPASAATQTLGSSAVMRSCHVAGHPAWIIDDYVNRTRHFVFGCAPDLFLHVHLDAHGIVTLTEKTPEHATLRSSRRDATGTWLADEAVVQDGEGLDDVARRCGVTTDALLAANRALAGGTPVPGTLVRLL